MVAKVVSTAAASPHRPQNVIGIVGLSSAILGAVMSPLPLMIMSPEPLLIVIPLALLGFIASATALFRKPRWYGVAGLLVSLSCVAGWGASIWYFVDLVRQPMNQYNLSFSQYFKLMSDYQDISWGIEAYRSQRGALPPALANVHYAQGQTIDPWNNSYVYQLNATSPSGYTITSVGQDGEPDSGDDINLTAVFR